ncbi:threonine aldolase family protein [Bergeyella sp. RCAD1439]|uniref:threonine aldolase family protein n=1 Tax=Bergeyella anatis TaxID=3113737 RepID=UPI002E1890D0|nr:aminotransferase class I/II-fold pyridoxal phosphate-dependent enzyme [Bergeyella sp. RCAD1439]
MKYSFKNDYAEGAHPRLLERLFQENFLQQEGYGRDAFSINAEALLREAVGNPTVQVHFVSGGTQANLVVLSASLRPHEAVISPSVGHIANNETGAIEATGHKIISVETNRGILEPEQVDRVLRAHANVPHQVKPKMVYISNATELGTIYTKSELEALSAFCKSKNLYLYMDGARLGHALTAENNDLTLEDIAGLTDAFYLGGTKNGALFGEAIVLVCKALQEDFGFHVKQKGALLAKGRVLGIQFEELLKDGLYFDLARHANRQAMKIKAAFQQKGIGFLEETFTNQIFPLLENHRIEALSKNYDFYVWKAIDADRSAIRLITSWATTEAMTDRLVETILSPGF